MPSRQVRGRALCSLAVIALALMTGLATRGGDELRGSGPPSAPGRAPGPTPYIFGSNNCERCHSPSKQYEGKTLICELNQFPIWNEQDKHRIAYRALSGERGQRMGRLLGIDVRESKSCISCHGVSNWTRDPAEPGKFARIPGEIQGQSDGVSCVACHGAFKEWVGAHQAIDDPEWRNNTREQKEARYGMYDLWDPIKRTMKCVSCHVGNASDGKVVTHAMYAAGHPPLSCIEVATFGDAQPRHWQALGEKPQAIKDHLGYRPGTLELTELVAVSGVVTLRESMKLFADQVRGEGSPADRTTTWPELSRFDCTSCHHDLRWPGWENWRQQRGFATEPGRPLVATWPRVLVRLSVEAAQSPQTEARWREFESRLRSFHESLGAAPFGGRGAEAATKASALVAWADEVIKDLGAASPKGGHAIDRPAALRLLRRLCEMGADPVHDYDAARQIAWAFRTIYHEIASAGKPDAKLETILAELDKALLLTLPSAGKQTPIEDSLSERMQAVAEYKPASVQSLFTALGPLLPPD